MLSIFSQLHIMTEQHILEEVFAKMQGQTLEEYRTQLEFHARIDSESEKYLNQPVEKWPYIVMNWDTSKSSQRFSLDGQSQEQFLKNYPDGFCLGHANLAEFDKILCHFSRRDDGELWELGCPDRLAFLIVYLSEGYPISPPLVKPLESGEVILQGGHHRYAIAKAIDETEIPIHVVPEHKSQIDKLIRVRWADA